MRIRATKAAPRARMILPAGATATAGRTLPRKDDDAGGRRRSMHGHTLAILTMPRSASARIANGAILETAVSVTSDKLSVAIRATAGNVDDDDGGGGDSVPGDKEGVAGLARLRRYVGEVYSMAWDAALGLDERERLGEEEGEEEEEGNGDDDSDGFRHDDDDDDDKNREIASGRGWKLLDLIVYPQNMPNIPPEGWIVMRPDLSCVCSHDSIVNPRRRDVGRRGSALREYVDAANAERSSRGLGTLEALHVDIDATDDPDVVFLEDEDAIGGVGTKESYPSSSSGGRRKDDHDANDDGPIEPPGGASIRPPSSLYPSVCVGGTFDGMHYGHRKLLTFAISCVSPSTGRLLVGVKRDEMLTRKAYAGRIRPLNERVAGVLDFVGALAPEMMDRVRCVPLSDEHGPPVDDSRAHPGSANDFDAMVLSQETLPLGRKFNVYREKVLGLGPLKLLVTQRTEPHGMSSTALRRMMTEHRL
ncbi:hypothetical protein ACHAW5_003618 [Stephanodiscus triporus]|uniref:Cytidyltransferase-like domain-containing protein n=1 Tax=Stephanodiscus triporus TaxID=2934178 RepID=A0ABD3PBM0_9STRA